MNYNMKIKIIVLMTIFSCQLFAVDFANLKVVFKDTRNNDGNIYVSVHNNPSTFPMQAEKALTKDVVTGKEKVIVFKNIPYGEYAVAVFHDENGNGKMDTHIFGIPKEGVGASNNKMGFGPPNFKDSAFMLNEPDKTITIDIKYL
ncbi:MAG: DUF2141 domain-containing protein [Candidatus Riflemargulisbacteria bacterium]